MQGFRNLNVWRKAHELTLAVYKAAGGFPWEERYALTSQTKRSSSSIGANIAEGCARGSDADFTRFLFIAMGSANELENHLELARDLEFLSPADYDDLLNKVIEVKKMLSGLIHKTQVRGASR
ncbi:MAG TPA: four helix bundle protein [Pyrinomonadaceae bacterium]|nr:four helix bundle protein [Pyrinomonadaceae bacterium]